MLNQPASVAAPLSEKKGVCNICQLQDREAHTAQETRVGQYDPLATAANRDKGHVPLDIAFPFKGSRARPGS